MKALPDESHDLAKLRQFLVDHFDREELRSLCFDLEVDFDSLPAEGKAGKARELVAYMGRHSRLEDLVTALQKLRPVAWEEWKLPEPSRLARGKSWWGSQSDTVKAAYRAFLGCL